jgi:ketosteroid isomerase-like protein
VLGNCKSFIEEENFMIGALIAKKIGPKGFEALNQGNLAEFMESWADDSIFIYPGNVKVSGTFKGKKEIEKWFKHMIEQYPERAFSIQNVYVRNICAFGATNSLAVEWQIELKNREGKEYKNFGVTVIDIKKGKAVSVRDYFRFMDYLKEGWGE